MICKSKGFARLTFGLTAMLWPTLRTVQSLIQSSLVVSTRRRVPPSNMVVLRSLLHFQTVTGCGLQFGCCRWRIRMEHGPNQARLILSNHEATTIHMDRVETISYPVPFTGGRTRPTTGGIGPTSSGMLSIPLSIRRVILSGWNGVRSICSRTLIPDCCRCCTPISTNLCGIEDTFPFLIPTELVLLIRGVRLATLLRLLIKSFTWFSMLRLEVPTVGLKTVHLVNHGLIIHLRRSWISGMPGTDGNQRGRRGERWLYQAWRYGKREHVK